MKLLQRVDAVCPWCGQTISMGVLQLDADDVIPASEQGKDVVLHVEPTCPMFDAQDGDDFVESAKDKAAGKRVSA